MPSLATQRDFTPKKGGVLTSCVAQAVLVSSVNNALSSAFENESTVLVPSVSALLCQSKIRVSGLKRLIHWRKARTNHDGTR